jgi:hypothetical protein
MEVAIGLLVSFHVEIDEGHDRNHTGRLNQSRELAGNKQNDIFAALTGIKQMIQVLQGCGSLRGAGLSFRGGRAMRCVSSSLSRFVGLSGFPAMRVFAEVGLLQIWLLKANRLNGNLILHKIKGKDMVAADMLIKLVHHWFMMA